MATELEYEDIVRYKTSTDSKYRPGLSDNDKRNIREKAARYVLHHQLLYVVEVDKDLGTEKKRRVIVKEEEKKTILTMCHSGIDGMHFGRDKTYFKVISYSLHPLSRLMIGFVMCLFGWFYYDCLS